MPLDKPTILNTVKEAKEKSEKRNFDQSIELILRLKEIDMKSPEAKIQEVVELPNTPPKKNKICVIASGELAMKAKRANADRVVERSELEGLAGKKKDLRKISNDYDVFIAEAPLMPLVGRILGPTLGPRGKMPFPVPPQADMAPLITRYGRTIVVRMRGQPVLQCSIGTYTMKDDELADNILTVLRAIEAKLKKGMKNVRDATIKTSMGPPIRIKP